MANKFQKSVQERLEQQKAKPEPAAVAAPGAPVKEKAPIKEKTPAPPANPAAPPVDLGRYLQPMAQRDAKNKTFYLDTAVIEGVKTHARQQGVTDSRLVNDILRRVLQL